MRLDIRLLIFSFRRINKASFVDSCFERSAGKLGLVVLDGSSVTTSCAVPKPVKI
jgi:hypothetical protein